VCKCGSGPACAGTTTCCDGKCVDLKSDPNNCNGCGRVCTAGAYCCKGNCTPPNDNDCAACGDSCSNGNKCCVCAGKAPQCSGLCLCL
jgi:hypothetical protein